MTSNLATRGEQSGEVSPMESEEDSRPIKEPIKEPIEPLILLTIEKRQRPRAGMGLDQNKDA